MRAFFASTFFLAVASELSSEAIAEDFGGDLVANEAVGAMPTGLNEAMLALVANANATCLQTRVCGQCKTAGCHPCNLNSAGTYAFANMASADVKKLDKYYIPLDNFACTSDATKCDKIASIFDAAQTTSNLVTDYVKTSSECEPLLDVKATLLNLVGPSLDKTCVKDGTKSCQDCVAAGCTPCSLHDVGKYVFDDHKDFFTSIQLSEFSAEQMESKLICGIPVGPCLEARDAVEQAVTALGFKDKYNKVEAGTCDGISSVLKTATLGLLLSMALY